jgi:hypothetical protein
MSPLARVAYALLVPVGMAVRLLADPLRLRKPMWTNWQPARESGDR